MRSDLPTVVDTVIVGAGSAGCVLAERLSRNPDRSVLLLDRGTADWPSSQVRDLRALPIEGGSPYATYHDEATGLGVVRGRGLGGSSSVNGGYFLRWHADDFVDWQWRIDDVAHSYEELDGAGGTMAVSAFADDELAPVVDRFESYWGRILPVRGHDDPWPIVGVNRVRSNRDLMFRMTAAEAYLRPALRRPNLMLGTDAEVDVVVSSGSRVTGVRLGDEVVGCGEVVLSGGTLGTAAILLRSELETLGGIDELPVHEHREVLVHYRSRIDAATPTALLQSVVHTDDDLELRCYSADMGSYIKGLPSAGPAMGVAVMRPGTVGSIQQRAAGHPIVDLGTIDATTADRLQGGVEAIGRMLRSGGFADMIEPGSVVVDPIVRTSQHAWGSMPMGSRTDWSGAVTGLRGLRIVDGSILPTAGRSGPHATIMMVACQIGDQLAHE